MSQDFFSFETRAWSSSEGGNPDPKNSFEERRIEVRFRGDIIEIAYFAPSGRRGREEVQADAAGRDVPLRRIELKPWSILSFKYVYVGSGDAQEKAFQIRHADATGEVEERWFATFMPQKLIDRFALYDEEHLGGANAKTFAPPRDAAAEINDALHDSPSGQTQRQNDELFREAARANGMDELERDPEKGKKLLPSIPSLILRVVLIALVALKVCDMVLPVLSYSNTDVAALRETVDEPLDQVFEDLSVVFVILLVLMGVFRAAWGSLEPLVAQRLYLGRGRLMLVSNMS